MFKWLKKSPINYFSDLFIVFVAVFWMCFTIAITTISIIVTVQSMNMSWTFEQIAIDTTLWAITATNVVAPVVATVITWMLKNKKQWEETIKQGDVPEMDFPDNDEVQG